MSRLKNIILISGILLPLHNVFAAATIEGLAVKFKKWLGLTIPILIGLGLAYFFWGLAMFIGNSGSEQGREEGKSKMIWGTLGMFVMVSIWGLTTFIGQTIEVDPGGTFIPPTF